MNDADDGYNSNDQEIMIAPHGRPRGAASLHNDIHLCLIASGAKQSHSGIASSKTPRNYSLLMTLCMVPAVLILFSGLVSGLQAAESYTFGVVPQYEQRQLYSIWKPIVAELQRRTGLSFTLVTAPKIPSFEKELLNGGYDFAYMNPYHFLKAAKSSGYAPILRDRTSLRGILVVRKDSPVHTLSELNGKVVAFPSPNALGASLLMRADLSRLYNVNIVPLYVVTHDSVYLHVAKGLADAGGGVQKTLEEQGNAVKEALRIIYTTRALPSHPIAVHPKVPRTIADSVRRAFLEMAATGEGEVLLSRIPMKHPISASTEDYEDMRKWGLESFWSEE